MAKLLLTLHLAAEEATLARVKARLDIDSRDIDADFGVVCVSPEQDLYAVLVEEEVAGRLTGHEAVHGAHSNPRIEPFGPPER